MDSHKGPVTNWDGSVTTTPRLVVRAKSVKDLVAVLRDKARFPSPVRPIGSNFSPNRCNVADNGTLLDMRDLNRIVEIGSDTIRVQAGVLLSDIVRILEGRSLQLYANPPCGNITAGAVACTASCDASMPGEFGQLSSYVTAMKIVTPIGKLLNVTEKQSDVLRIMRSGYGLMGVVYEVTFKVRPLKAQQVRIFDYDLEEFSNGYDDLIQAQAALRFRFHPFARSVQLEMRNYGDGLSADKQRFWKLNNWSNETVAPAVDRVLNKVAQIRGVRNLGLDATHRALDALAARTLDGNAIVPGWQVRRYGGKKGKLRHSFSVWAFSQLDFPKVLEGYFELCRRYSDEHAYRCGLVTTGERIAADDSSLLSYSVDGPVVTLRVSGWPDQNWGDFLAEFNEFAAQHKGRPLLNQSRAVAHKHASVAYGARLKTFATLRRRVDPDSRLLNHFYEQIIAHTTV